VFLVILLLLFYFWRFLGQRLCKTIVFLTGEVTHPAKSFRTNGGVSQLDLRRLVLTSISFATARSVIANGYQAAVNAAGYFAVLARPNSGSNTAVSESSHNGYVRNRELSRGTKCIMRRFRDAIKMHRHVWTAPFWQE
jgi:hypothetical protein